MISNTLYLCVNGVAVSEVTDSQTERQTDKLSTVTLAAHARRGLIIIIIKINVHRGTLWYPVHHLEYFHI